MITTFKSSVSYTVSTVNGVTW